MLKLNLLQFFYEGLFYSSNGYVDDKYYQEVSPEGTAFAIIWPIIYVWNTVAIVYIAVSMCLPERKSPVNTQPTLVPIVSHLLKQTNNFSMIIE